MPSRAWFPTVTARRWSTASVPARTQTGSVAGYTVGPAELAVGLPDAVDDALGADLGIPGITAHRCVFADGPVSGATVRRTVDLERVPDGLVHHAVAHDAGAPAGRVLIDVTR